VSIDSRALAAFRRQPSPGRIPKLPTKPAAYVTGHQYRPKGVPAKQQPTYWHLAGQFRGGDIYSFSWDPRAEEWLMWRTEADWLATERNGQVARPDLAELGHGPETFEPVAAPKKARKRTATPAPVAPVVDVAPVAPPAAPPVAPVGTVDVGIAGRIAALISLVSTHRDPAAALDVLEQVAAGWEVPAAS